MVHDGGKSRILPKGTPTLDYVDAEVFMSDEHKENVRAHSLDTRCPKNFVTRTQKNCSCTWAQDTFFDMASWASQDTQFAHLGTVILEGYIRLGKASLWPYVLTPPLGKLILKATYDLARASPLPYIPVYVIQSFAKFLKWHPRKFWHTHASQNDIQTFSKFLKRHPRKIWHTQAALSLSQIYIYINIYI